ncbi:MAG: ABC transporter ATP-binding protein, partial [Succiniclasticum sp.]|nr:ABC transporter ATP-binding protein [Succiniclasticum sp.]
MSSAIKVEHVSKEYRLGAIGGGTLRGDLQSWWARVRHQEDPSLRIDQAAGTHRKNERFLALNDVSFSAQQGEAIGIIGHNGAGKTTMLKLISRVTAPSAGTISYNGRIASMLEVGTGFHPEMTGRENIYMNGAILGMTKAEIARKFDEIVEFAEMRQFIDTPVKRYSSGMYVKLAFAVAAHLDSEIMIMDEVLAVGDAKFQQKCLGKMGDAASNQGRTVLYVSHNMSTIRQLCSRCIVLSHGQKVF